MSEESISPELIFRRIALFSSLPAGEVAHLAATLQLRQFPEQAILLKEGHRDDHFYILTDGQVEIIKALGTDAERRLGVRQKGNLLGEMSLFTPDGSHTASVRALTPLQALEMTRADFDALLHRQPRLAYEMVATLSRRLEESENLTILDLREKNRQLLQAYEELKAAQAQIIEKERLERELEIARQIQISILPQALPAHPDLDIGALMIPARAVGGDFYDMISLGEGQMGVVVGDVSDKGVPAALFMALTYSLVRAEASRAVSPADVLDMVNNHLLDINASGMFVTLLYGILECDSGCFHYARAGHPQPVIMDRHGLAVKLPMGVGQPLGLFDDPPLDEQSVLIPPGGTALIYSDGLNEAMNAKGDTYGVQRLHKCLSSNLESSASEICNHLWESVKAYCGSLPQQDDFTVVTIKRIAK